MRFEIKDDLNHKEVFTVEEKEKGLFQSVFPTRLAEKSQLHVCQIDAWNHIHEVRFADLCNRVDHAQDRLTVVHQRVMDHVNTLVAAGLVV